MSVDKINEGPSARDVVMHGVSMGWLNGTT